MKSIKVNADYESVLFHNKPLPVINESLEFLALYLSDKPLLSQKKYADHFLDHVESFTGIRPSIVKDQSFENWWGDLRNIELEKKLNSKEMSAEFYSDNLVVRSKFSNIDADKPKGLIIQTASQISLNLSK